MSKRLVLALLLAIGFATSVNVAQADAPWPDCLPCPLEN
jgi:hypothetical protein